MRKIGAVVAVVALLAVAFQVYVNTAEDHPADAKAEAIACRQLGTCTAAEYDRHERRVSPFQRTYVFETSRGTIEVRCRWPYVLYGEPECTGEREGVMNRELPAGDQPPHATKRSARDLK